MLTSATGKHLATSLAAVLLPASSWGAVFTRPNLDVPRLLAASDVVACVEGLVPFPVDETGEFRQPTTWRFTVVRTFKGPPGLEGKAVQWVGPRLADEPGGAYVGGPRRALVFLKAKAEGGYALTDPTGGFLLLGRRAPPESGAVTNPLEAIRTELLYCLRDEDLRLVSAAAARLGYLPPDARTEEALLELLDGRGLDVALTACAALIRMGAGAGVEAAVDLLRQPPPPPPGDPGSRAARESLLRRVAEINDDAYVRHLAGLMAASQTDVREAAAEALANMPSPEAVKALGEALWDTDQMVRYRVITSLEEITHIRGHVPLPDIYRENEDEYLGFWRRWYEEVGRPGIGEPDGEQGEAGLGSTLTK